MAKHKRIVGYAVFLALLLGCADKNSGPLSAQKTPAPGQNRIPQIYVAWDSSSNELLVPWAAPSAADFESGFGARVEYYSPKDPGDLEKHLRDWNSRPFDMILVGPDPKILAFVKALKLPDSAANRPRIFLTSVFAKDVNSGDGWQVKKIDETPAMKFLTDLCAHSFGPNRRGCHFSQSALQHKLLQLVPAGGLSIQFSPFPHEIKPGDAPPADIALRIGWEALFDELTAHGQAKLKTPVETLRFSDGLIKIDAQKNLPKDVDAFVKMQSLKMLDHP